MTHPELHHLGDAKVYRRCYWQKRGEINKRNGLSWRGKKLKRTLPDIPGVHGAARHAIRNQQRAERFMATGLTWRGTKRKRRVNVAHAWKQFRKAV